jgi:hypothetical protein
MPTTHLEAARLHHLALKHFFLRHTSEASDPRALRQVLTLCEAAGAAIDDDYARDKLHQVGEYAAEMLAHDDHAKWGRDSMSGAEFLRQQVLNALELFASRLYSIEALRRAAENEGTLPWTTRSGIAQI